MNRLVLWIASSLVFALVGATDSAIAASALSLSTVRTTPKATITPSRVGETAAISVRFRIPLKLSLAARRRAFLFYRVQGGTHGRLPSTFPPLSLRELFGLPRSPREVDACGPREVIYSQRFKGYVNWYEKSFAFIEIPQSARLGTRLHQRIGGGLAGGWCPGLHDVTVALVWPRSTRDCVRTAQPYGGCLAVRTVARGEFLVGPLTSAPPPNCLQDASPCRGHQAVEAS